MLRGLWLSLVLLWGAAPVFLSCAAPTVLIDGREVSTEEAARLTLARAEEAERQGDVLAAENRYREVVEIFEGTDAVPLALAGLAQIKLERSGCDAARLYDERLLQAYSKSPEAEGARARRRSCQAEGAAEAEPGEATLADAYRAAGSNAEKLRIAHEAAAAADEGGDPATAALWLLKVLDLSPDDGSRAELRRNIEERVLAVGPRGLRLIKERTRSADFPRELVDYRLAKVQLHVGDVERGESGLEAFLAEHPEGRFSAEVAELLEGLRSQSRVEPKRLGVLLPLSGRHKNYGELALQAIRMGLEGASDVELVVQDTASDEVRAAQGVEKLVREHAVIGVLGPIFTYEARPAAIEAQRLGVPLLTISADDGITDIGPFVFRNGVTNRAQMEALVGYAMDVAGMRRFAILYPRHPYGEELLHLFWDEVEARGGEIRGVESYGLGDTTFSRQVKALVARDDLERRADYRKAIRECDEQPDNYRKARCRENVRKNLRPLVDFDGLFIPDYPGSVSMISAALAFEDIIVEQDPRRLRVIEKTLGRKVEPVTLLGASGWNSAKLIERAERNVENALFTDGFFADSVDPETRSFVKRYREAHGRTPRLYPEALFYDSARMMAGQLGGVATREALRARLSAVDGFSGVTGKTSFDGGSDASKVVQILRIHEGRIEAAPPEGPKAEPDTPES
ncbi:MAG: penicillin-binding protein activator [Myxococcota bacterium]